MFARIQNSFLQYVVAYIFLCIETLVTVVHDTLSSSCEFYLANLVRKHVASCQDQCQVAQSNDIDVLRDLTPDKV